MPFSQTRKSGTCLSKWVRLVVTRTNTETGVAYNQDPTILAWELINEPHTDDGFESELGLTPGSIVCSWVSEMSAYIKSLDGNHLISTGEEGYRADLTSDSSTHSWMNNGIKGGDFVCNTCRTGITLATVHLCADAWGFTSSDYEWLGENFLADRRRAALACGKPSIVEEVRGLFLRLPASGEQERSASETDMQKCRISLLSERAASESKARASGGGERIIL